MKNLRNSRRNRTDYAPGSARVAEQIEEFVARYEAYRRNKEERALSKDDRTKYVRHMQIILLDLLAAWEGDETIFIGYSRGGHAFRRGGSYWDQSQDKPILSERIYLGLIDFLHAEDFIENHVMPPGREDMSSRMRANDRLKNKFRERGLNWTSIVTDLEAEVIFVNEPIKEKKPDKTAEKIWKKIRKKKKKKKRLIPPPKSDSFDIEAARANLRRINANLQTTFISLVVSDVELGKIRARLVMDEASSEEPREPFELSNRTLRRIFSLGGYENGGRFYGGWWQGIPSQYRKFIEIDGAMTREMDFSCQSALNFDPLSASNIAPPLLARWRLYR